MRATAVSWDDDIVTSYVILFDAHGHMLNNKNERFKQTLTFITILYKMEVIL